MGRKSYRKLKITCEILPPGTLKRKCVIYPASPEQRWKEIQDICAEVIRKNRQKK